MTLKQRSQTPGPRARHSPPNRFNVARRLIWSYSETLARNLALSCKNTPHTAEAELLACSALWSCKLVIAHTPGHFVEMLPPYLKAKTRQAWDIFERELPPKLSEMFKQTTCLFGSTYLCEKLFSTMKCNKSKYRSRQSDVHLQTILRVSTATSLRAKVAQLSEKKCCQVSGSKH